MFFKSLSRKFLPFYRTGRLYSKVPFSAIIQSNNNLKESVRITQETVDHLERLALVDLANKKGLERLQSAIEFANQIIQVDTNAVDPMITVLEDRNIYLRDDRVDDENCREDVMANAKVTEEEYFVAPPGNIPVNPRQPIMEESSDIL